MSDLELIKTARKAAHEYFDHITSRFRGRAPEDSPQPINTDTAAAVSFIQALPDGGSLEQRIIWRIVFAEQLRALGL